MRLIKTLTTIILALLLISSPAFAIGYVTSTYMQPYNVNPNIQDSSKLIEYSWCSTTGGIASITLTTQLNEGVKGWYLYQIDTIPDATDIFVPTALYDIAVLGPNGLDIAGGSVLNRSATARESVQPASFYLINDTIGIYVYNSGNITKGKMRLIFVK